jgi:glutamyl-tRNA reductase
MVIGEVDIIHQVKRMYELATDAGTTGLLTDRAFHQAFMVAKKAQNDTRISVGSTSVAKIAVEHAERHLGSLSDVRAAVVGAGKMSLRMARYLGKHGAGDITLVNRTVEKAQPEAQRLGARVVGLSRLRETIDDSDLLMISIEYDRGYLLDGESLREIAAGRDGRELTVVDISTPRVVERGGEPSKGIRVFDMDDFEAILAENLEHRRAAVVDVERIIDTVVERFSSWRREARVLPDIIRLRKKVKRMCEEELERYAATIPEEMVPAVKDFATALTERIINAPIQTLRSWMEASDGGEPLDEFRQLFDLDVVDEYYRADSEGAADGDRAARCSEAQQPNCELCGADGCVHLGGGQSESAS